MLWSRSRPLRRKRDRDLSACPAGAVTHDKRNYFSVDDTLVSPRGEYASRAIVFSDAQMADHIDHNLTHHTLRRTGLGSVDADFLHRASRASSFLRELLNSRGEESFTTVLHRALHRSLHPSAAGKAEKLIR